jgi:hypothetical protein
MKKLLLLVLAGALACHPEASSVGTLTVSLSSPSTHDGALVLLIAGGPVTDVQPTSGYQVATTVDSVGTHLIFIGDLVAGQIATVQIPDISRSSQYLAVVEQVADRSEFTLLDPSRYRVTLQPAGSVGTPALKAP